MLSDDKTDACPCYIICETQRSTIKKVNIIFDFGTQRYCSDASQGLYIVYIYDEKAHSDNMHRAYYVSSTVRSPLRAFTTTPRNGEYSNLYFSAEETEV